MKKLIIALLLTTMLTGCRSCYTSFAEQKKGVHKVCPTCNFVRSENTYYAVDTAKQPNIIYRVNFKTGGIYYTASEVEDLIRVN